MLEERLHRVDLSCKFVSTHADAHLTAADLRSSRAARPQPSAAASTVPGVLVREWQDGCEVECALLVRGAELRTKRDGGEYMKLQLGDRSGSVAAMIWDDVPALRELCRAGCVVLVRGRYTVHPRYGPQLAIVSLKAACDGEYSPDDLLDGPPRTAEQMETDLRELLTTVREPHLARLLELVFGSGSSLWRRFRDAPAAKHYHQAYRHGLLEHCLTVAQAVSAISATFPGIDRDVAITGALLHDIGKLDAYSDDPQAIDLTDAGRLQGEIPLGYYRVRRAIEEIPAFPPALAEAVLHIILAHHGSLEHGSPVVPCTREATLVHMIDNLGGRLGSFDRLEKELPTGAVWSSWDKALGAGAYFAPRESTAEAA
jgi:3'-5' exoribonuclease